MKKTVYVLFVGLALHACKAPSYSYLPSGRNTIAYSRAGEGNIAAGFGTEGFTAKGGIALAQNVNINGWVAGMPEQNNGYTSRESEFSIGFQTTPKKKNVGMFSIGVGNGSNEKDKVGLSGHYTRGFVQIQGAEFDKPLGGKFTFDGAIGLRVNYLWYNGSREGSNFDDNLIFYEPYFGAAIGGENVYLQLISGLSVKNPSEWNEGVEVFPFFASLGILVKLRKNR